MVTDTQSVEFMLFLITVNILQWIFPLIEKYGTSPWTSQRLANWTAVFSFATLWSSYNKRQPTADGVAARQQPRSLFFTENLTKLSIYNMAPWWILDRVLLSFLNRIIKKKLWIVIVKLWCWIFIFMWLYATNVRWNNGRATFLFFLSFCLNSFMWQPEGSMAAKTVFISSLLTMKTSWHYEWSTQKLMMTFRNQSQNMCF